MSEKMFSKEQFEQLGAGPHKVKTRNQWILTTDVPDNAPESRGYRLDGPAGRPSPAGGHVPDNCSLS
ncbi:hypothetical protein ABZU75_45545, partial [Streptosporangium sp. NPDC005286]|uniref:hypothetical protein n=1 Tax=Streptosporangium sp. NPDC005286 TaxID=3154463 RepID=UPI00339DFB61